jgi:hypothetical protein
MAKISEKRFDGHYKITTSGTDSNVTIKTKDLKVDGNLIVQGTKTEVETTNSTISDNTIVLNSGETGAGITATTAGIEIERGTATNVTILFDDSIDSFTFKEGSSLTTVSGGTPTTATHLTTKAYVDGLSSGVALTGSTNNTITTVTGANAIIGEANLTFDGSTLAVTGAATVSTTLDVTGNVTTDGLLRLTQTSDPSAVSGKSLVYAKAPGGGGTGVYVQAPSGSAEEMVSKSKAIVYGLIF